MVPTMTQNDSNRELVALITAVEQLQNRITVLARGQSLRGIAEDHLWNANDRLADARTNLELTLHFNR